MRTIEGIERRAAGFRFAIVVSKYNDFVTDRLQAGALAALAAAGVAPSDITRRARAGRVRDSARGAARGRERPVRRDHLPRLPDPRRDAALRVHRVGGGARADDGGGGDRRADDVRRADDELDRGGAGARRRGPGEQGARGGGRGDRDGGGRRAADAAGDAEDASRMARARKDPRHRAREAALQILYQWEIGGATSTRRPRRSSRCSGPTPTRRPTSCATFADRAGARHGRAARARSTR